MACAARSDHVFWNLSLDHNNPQAVVDDGDEDKVDLTLFESIVQELEELEEDRDMALQIINHLRKASIDPNYCMNYVLSHPEEYEREYYVEKVENVKK